MPTDLQKRMFNDLAQKDAFEVARHSAYEYADGALARRVYPTQQDLRKLELFSEGLPDDGWSAVEIIQQLHRIGSPATVTSTGGRYFGMVTGGAIPAALGARWLADVWDQTATLYKTSPVAAKLEDVCEGWLKEIFDLPDDTAAGFVSGTSMAILCGLAAGRYRLCGNKGWDINAKGLNGAPAIRIVASRQAHGTVGKAIALLGFGVDNVEWVDADEQGRMAADAVPTLDDSTLLILQAGNVNSGAFDDFDVLCGRAESTGAWVHIDGAFGLWAAGCERLSHLTRGMERAHSWSVDGHKTLNTPYDSGIVLCRDRRALVGALQTTGSYILYGDERDGMLYTPEMSRRARAIELWASLKYLGRRGIDELVGGLHDRAVQMSVELHEAGFQVLNHVVFNQVLVACDDDATTDSVIEHVQASGECWAGGSKWRGRSVIRISVCSWATTEEDVTRSVQAFVDARQSVKDRNPTSPESGMASMEHE